MSSKSAPNSGSGMRFNPKGSKSTQSVSTGTRPKLGSAGSGLSTPSSASSASTRSAKPSGILNPKTIDPFAAPGKSKSTFSSIYSNGGVPCRLVHGSVKHKLAWNSRPEDIPFDPVLLTLAEGLREKVHPYTFVARQGFKELLDTPDASDKATPLVPKLIPALRTALADSDAKVFEAGLQALDQLSNTVGPALNGHLKTLLVPVSKRSMEKRYRDLVYDSLQQLEINGGKDALLLIKAKIPTYSSVT